jgi:hypothetical protein
MLEIPVARTGGKERPVPRKWAGCFVLAKIGLYRQAKDNHLVEGFGPLEKTA